MTDPLSLLVDILVRTDMSYVIVSVICTLCAPVDPKSPFHKYWTLTWTDASVESVIVKWAVSPSVTEVWSAVILIVRSRVLAVDV